MDDAIKWIYPDGVFDPNIALNSVILASTNDAVDNWNVKIQSMNKNIARTYYSRDMFNEVDDEKGILNGIIKDDHLMMYLIDLTKMEFQLMNYHLKLMMCVSFFVLFRSCRWRQIRV